MLKRCIRFGALFGLPLLLLATLAWLVPMQASAQECVKANHFQVLFGAKVDARGCLVVATATQGPQAIPQEIQDATLRMVVERLKELREPAPHSGLNAVRAATKYKVASFQDYVMVLGLLQQLSNPDFSDTDIQNLARDLIRDRSRVLDLIF